MRHYAVYRLGTWGVKNHLGPFVKLENYDFQKYNSDKAEFTMTRTSTAGPLTCQHHSPELNFVNVILYYFPSRGPPKQQ